MAGETLVYTIGVDYSSATQGMRAFQTQATANADAVAKAIEKPFETLGIRSTQTINAAASAQRAALDQVKQAAQSGTASLQDVARAQDAYETKIKSLTKEAGVAQGGLRGLYDQVTGLRTAFQSGAGGVALLDVAMSALKNPILAVATAIGAIVAAGISMAHSLVEDAKAVKQLMNITGLAVEQADDLANALQLMGKDVADVSMSFFRLSAEVESGGDSINKLGISLVKTGDIVKTEGELWMELRDRISSMATSTERMSALTDVFGSRVARNLLGVFTRSREEFEKFLEKGKLYSPMTEDMLKASLRFTAAQRESQIAWQGLTNVIGQLFLPVLTLVNLGLAKVYLGLKTLAEGVISVGSAVRTGIDQAAAWAMGWEDAAVRATRAVADWALKTATFGLVNLPPQAPRADVLPETGVPLAGPGPQIEQEERVRKAVEQARLKDIEVWKTAELSALDIVSASQQAALARGLQSEREAAAQSTRIEIARAQTEIESINKTIAIKTAGTGKKTADEFSQYEKLYTELKGLESQRAAAESKIQEARIKGDTAVYQAEIKAAQNAGQLIVEIGKATSANTVQAAELALAGQEDMVDQLTNIKNQAAVDDAARAAKVAKEESDARMGTLEQQQAAYIKYLQARTALGAAEVAQELAFIAQHQSALKAVWDMETADRKSALDDQLAAIKQTEAAAAQATAQRLNETVQAIEQSGAGAVAAAEQVAAAQVESARDAAANRVAAALEAEAAIVQAEQDTQAQLAEMKAEGLNVDKEVAASILALDAARRTREAAEAQARVDIASAESSARLGVWRKYYTEVQGFLQSETQKVRESVAGQLAALEGYAARQVELGRDAEAVYAQYWDARARIVAAGIQAELAAYEAETKQLADLNAAGERAFQDMLERRKQVAISFGDVGAAISAEFAQALTKGRDFWSNMERMAQDAAQGMTENLSTFFFDVLSGKVGAVQDLFKNMWATLKKGISDFFANTITNQIGEFFGSIVGIGRSGSSQLNQAAAGTAVILASRLSPAADAAAASLANVANAASIAAGASGGNGSFTGGLSEVGGLATGLVSLGAAGGSGFNLSSTLGLGKTVLDVARAGSSFGQTLTSAGASLDSLFGTGGGVVALGTEMDAVVTTVGTFEGAASSASRAISGLSSTIGGVAGAIGAAYGLYSLIDSMNKGTSTPLSGAITGAGIGIGATAAIGAVAGIEFGPIGMAVGALIGAAGGALLGWLGSAHVYMEKRIKAAQDANEGLTGLDAVLQKAAKSGSATQLQSALGSTFAGGSIRADLELPAAVARSLGISGTQIGNLVRTEWTNLTREQFNSVIAMFKSSPALMQTSIVGSGDVPYLQGADAQKAAGQAKDAAIAMITAFNALGDFTEQINTFADTIGAAATAALPGDFAAAVKTGLVEPLRVAMLALKDSSLSADDLTKALKDFQTRAEGIVEVIKIAGGLNLQQQTLTTTARIALPSDYGQQFIDTVLNPLRDRLKSILTTTLDPEEMKQALATLGREQDALLGLVSAFDTITGELQAMSGSLDAITDRAIAGYAANIGQLSSNVDAALKNLGTDADAAGRSYEEELGLIQAAHQAVIAKYEYEMNAIKALEQQMGDLLTSVGNQLVGILTDVGMHALAQGNLNPMADLIVSLTTTALTAKSTAEATWAFNQALAAIGNTALGLASSVGRVTAITGVGQSTSGIQAIVQAMYDQAAPLITDLQTKILTAIDKKDVAGAIGLLQQEEKAVRTLATAAVNAVEAWRAAAIKAVNDSADAQIKAATTSAKHDTDLLNAQLKGYDAQRKANDEVIKGLTKQQDGIRKAADLEVKANEKTISGLEKQIKAINDVANAQIKANEKTIKDIDGQVKAIEAAAKLRTDANQAVIDDLSGQLKGIQDVAKAQEDANQLRIDALTKESDAIRDQIDRVKDWQAAIDATRKYLRDLALSTSAPLNPRAQMDLARGAFDQALAAYQAGPSAKGLSALQEAGDQYLTSTQGVYTRPSLQYQDIYKTITDALDRAATAAEGIRGPATLDDLNAQLTVAADALKALQDDNKRIGADADAAAKALQTRIDALKDDNDRIAKETEAQTAPLKAQAESLQAINDSIREKADEAIAPLQEQVDQLNDINTGIREASQAQIDKIQEDIDAVTAINDGLTSTMDAIKTTIDDINSKRDDQIDAINSSRDQQILAINDAADTQVKGIVDGLSTTLDRIAAQEKPLFEDMRDKIRLQEDAVTGGKTVQDFIRTATESAAADLSIIRQNLDAYLRSLASPPPIATGPASGGTTPAAPAITTAQQWYNVVYAENVAQPGQSWATLVGHHAAQLPQLSAADFDMLAAEVGMTHSDFLQFIKTAQPNYSLAARGALISHPTRAIVGEAGTELVLPPEFTEMFQEMAADRRAGRGDRKPSIVFSPTINVTGAGGRDTSADIVRALNEWVRHGEGERWLRKAIQEAKS